MVQWKSQDIGRVEGHTAGDIDAPKEDGVVSKGRRRLALPTCRSRPRKGKTLLYCHAIGSELLLVGFQVGEANVAK